ncbi:MAG TPA: ATP-binding protein [candidate division Zixibacteria bacterium]|nr:ATP-binding protein [candidate division Zixibacteria bacterium]
MPTLRLRLIGLFVLLALAVAGVMILAVQRFGSEQIMRLAMEAGASEEEAQAMFDQYIGQVLLIGAGMGVALGGVAAWWLLRRILRPLERLTRATRSIAAGDFAARVPPAPDPELQQLADAFNQMAATLERVEQLRRSLVEDVAHELRTPLTSLQGYLEAMADGVVEPTPDILRSVHEEIVRLTRLVEDLDRLARGESAARELARAEVDLAAVVQRAVAIASPELANRRISVRIEDPASLPTLMADPDAIGQVVTNLVQNAARYTADGGMVSVRLSAADGWVRCAIENTGVEIPPDELPLIWERLYRVDPSRARASGGAGIGLAIVRQIVEAHGGRVGATSGGGRTVIWFSLPAQAG